jgi:hypothetical protein
MQRKQSAPAIMAALLDRSVSPEPSAFTPQKTWALMAMAEGLPVAILISAPDCGAFEIMEGKIATSIPKSASTAVSTNSRQQY